MELLIELALYMFHFLPWQRVPAVIGMDAGKAWAVLAEHELTPVGTSEDAIGRVVAQHPPPGKWRRKRSEVQVLVSSP